MRNLLALALFLLVACHWSPATAAAEPVRVDYYMEALCPYCANFTLTQLQPLFKNKLINHVQLDVIPYGNARTDPNTGVVSCQHGNVECQLNKLLSCAIAYNPIQDDWFPFLACVEEASLKGLKPEEVEATAHKCAVHAGLVPTRLMSCYAGALGDSLQRLAAQRTASLRPAHQYVPWVVVNGIPLLDDMDNIMRYICVAYRGRDRPKVCLDIPSAPAGPPTAQRKLSATSAPQHSHTAQQQQQRFQLCRVHESQQQQQQQSGAAGAEGISLS